jgi:hypothetical protein
MKEVDVASALLSLDRSVNAHQVNGYQAACEAFTVLCHQYQLVGESLKLMSEMISNTATEEELEQVVPRYVLEELQRRFIILRRFEPQMEVEESVDNKLVAKEEEKG